MLFGEMNIFSVFLVLLITWENVSKLILRILKMARFIA